VRIFLDANILFSAAKSEGFVRRLLDLLAADGHTLCADAYVAEEARRNLATKGVRIAGAASAARSDRSRADIRRSNGRRGCRRVTGKRPSRACRAARLGCHGLVTGDRTHFGRFYSRRLAGFAIHSPRTLADLLL
jgi:hypothetical protein